jgi:raffinose-raffinose alpha-galactotransferase
MKVQVSIIITCKDKEKFLDDCIKSVFRQTKVPSEVLLVHDGCEEPARHDGVKTVILDKNYGVSTARDEGFRLSTKPLILFLDGDDVLSPDYIEKMILALVKNADIVYPDTFLWATSESKLTITPNKLTKEFVKKFEKVLIPVSCLMKREVYETLGGFKKMEALEDMDFWIRAMSKGFRFKKAHTLLWYRQTANHRNSLPMERRKELFKEIISQL